MVEGGENTRKTLVVLLALVLGLAVLMLPAFATDYSGWETIRPLLKDGEGSEFVKPIPSLDPDVFSGVTEVEAVQAAATWVAGHIAYQSDVGEVWTSSDQTYVRGTGDCEDYAILLCALLRFHTQGGVPAERVWVVVGLVTEPGIGVYAGHAWVGYKMERGGVLYIEPQLGILFRGNLLGYGGHMLQFNDVWVKGGGYYLAGPD